MAPVRAHLSRALLAGTAEARRQLEGSPFLAALFTGACGSGVYGEYVRALYCARYLSGLREVYGALEEALWRQRAHPMLRAVPCDEVLRAGAIDEDLRCLAGEDWELLRPPLSAAALHAERVRAVAAEAPCLLIAHAYAAAVCESAPAPLPCAWGVRTFQCPVAERGECELAQLASCAVTRRWARHLDTLSLREDEVDEVVQEASFAFRLRAQLCSELAQAA